MFGSYEQPGHPFSPRQPLPRPLHDGSQETTLERRLSRHHHANDERRCVDLDATGRHVETLLASGIHGVVMLSSLGEYQMLTALEKRRVLQFATIAEDLKG